MHLGVKYFCKWYLKRDYSIHRRLCFHVRYRQIKLETVTENKANLIQVLYTIFRLTSLCPFVYCMHIKRCILKYEQVSNKIELHSTHAIRIARYFRKRPFIYAFYTYIPNKKQTQTILLTNCQKDHKRLDNFLIMIKKYVRYCCITHLFTNRGQNCVTNWG